MEARERLTSLGMHNIRTLLSDGTLGWPEMAPFDRIIVAAGGPAFPKLWRNSWLIPALWSSRRADSGEPRDSFASARKTDG